MKRTISESVLYWLEAFDGAGYTFVFLVLAFGLRFILLAVDRTVTEG